MWMLGTKTQVLCKNTSALTLWPSLQYPVLYLVLLQHENHKMLGDFCGLVVVWHLYYFETESCYVTLPVLDLDM